MSYPTETGSILTAMGYTPEVDFLAERKADGIHITWSHTDPQPTEQQITDIASDTIPLPSGKTFTQSKEPEHYETSTSIKMATDLQSQAAFSNMMVLLREAGVADDYVVAIKDCFGVSHQMTFLAFTSIAVDYGLHCYTQFHS